MIIQIIMPHIFMILLKGGGESIQSNPAITDPSLLKNHKIIVIFPILQHFFLFLPRKRHMIIQIIGPHKFMILIKGEEKANSQIPQ